MRMMELIFIIGGFISTLLASTAMKVDMNPSTDGTQDEIVVTDTAKTFMVDFCGSGFVNAFSYQFSIAFDTSKVKYLGCDKDYGLTGTKNILAANGGSVNGICQKQLNPPANDTVDYGYAIFEDDSSLAVSGSGLLGIASFKSKMAFGDTAVISIRKAGWAEYSGTGLFDVDTVIAGRYIVLPVTSVHQGGCKKGFSTGGFDIAVLNSSSMAAAPSLTYIIAPVHGNNAVKCIIKLYDVRGQHIATVVDGAVAPGTYTVAYENINTLKTIASGILICTMRAENFSKTIKIWNGRY